MSKTKIKTRRQISASQGLFLLVASTVGLVSLGFSVFTLWVTSNQASKSIAQNRQEQAEWIVSEIDQVIQSHASQLTLLSYGGSTSPEIGDAERFAWLKSVNRIASDSALSAIQIIEHNDAFYARFATATTGNNYFVARIPLEDLFNSLRPSLAKLGFALEVKQLGVSVYSSTRPAAQESFVFSHLLPNVTGVALNLQSTIPNRSFPFSPRAIIETVIVFVSIVILTGMGAIILGRKLFVEPTEDLRKAAAALAQGEQRSPIDNQPILSDIALLATHFNEMVEKVSQREESLNARKQELETLNRKLVENQEQLVQSEKLATVGHLAASVAHEINNPIGFVNSNLEILSEYVDEISRYIESVDSLKDACVNNDKQALKKCLSDFKEAEAEHDIRYIKNDIASLVAQSLDGTNRIARFVKDLKSFSRRDSGEPEDFDPNLVAQQAVNLIRKEVEANGFLERSYASKNMAKGYPQRLCQVVMNLLHNASQAIKEGGTVKLKTYDDDNYAIIEVSDDGPGISAEIRESIFDAFFTTKPAGRGTGLGLNISQDIVAQHNGLLELASQPGEGARFLIKIPSATEAVETS